MAMASRKTKAKKFLPLLVSVSVLALGACASTENGEPKSTVDPKGLTVEAGNLDNPVAAAAYWGGRYEQKPGDAAIAANYGNALRGIGSLPQALTVLSGASRQHPENAEVLEAYGKALVAAGEAGQAIPVLVKAASLNPSDWRLVMAQGVAHDQLGEHRLARIKYRGALELAPDNPSILTNLGLSLALAGKLPQAEDTLRRAMENPAAGAKARQNLALVMSLQGRFDEAARLAKADLPPAIVNNNIDYIRSMMAQPALWKQMEQLDAPADTRIE